MVISEIKLFILFLLVGVIEVVKEFLEEAALCRNRIVNGRNRYRVFRQFYFSRMRLRTNKGLCQ